MKKIIAFILLAAMPVLAGPWIPISVNTNTWECKPYYDDGAGGLGTNYWNDLSSVTYVDAAIIAAIGGSGGPTVPSHTNSIALSNEFVNAAAFYSFTVTNLTPSVWDDAAESSTATLQPIGGTIPTWVSNAILTDITDVSYVETISGIGDGATNITVSLWFYKVAAAASYDCYAVSGDDAGFACGIHLDVSSDLKAAFSDQVTYIAQVVYTPSISDATWHHVVATYQRIGSGVGLTSAIKLYLNGTLVAQDVSAANLDVVIDRPWRIGYGEATEFVSGGLGLSDSMFDDVSIIPELWSASDVANVYSYGRSD